MIKIRSLETAVYRYPLKTPVQTSFGIMRDRPMVLVKLFDDEGVTGIGEIWCNFLRLEQNIALIWLTAFSHHYSHLKHLKAQRMPLII